MCIFYKGYNINFYSGIAFSCTWITLSDSLEDICSCDGILSIEECKSIIDSLILFSPKMEQLSLF